MEINRGFIRGELHARLSDAVGHEDIFHWLESMGESIANIGLDGKRVQFNRALLNEVGVAEIKVREGSEYEARVESSEKGFCIFLHDKLPILDRRALIAHEIAHVVLARNKAILRVIKSQKLNVDRDIEKVVDWLAYSILVPKCLLAGEDHIALFQKGYLLSKQWTVPPKIAFFRIMTAAADSGDLALQLSSQYEDASQLSLFNLPKSWRIQWSLLARRYRDGKRQRLLVEKGRNSKGFEANNGGQEFLEHARHDQVFKWMMTVTPLRRFIGHRSSVRAVAGIGELSKGRDGSQWVSYALWCR